MSMEISRETRMSELKKIAIAGLMTLTACSVALPLTAQQTPAGAKAPHSVTETEAEHRAKLAPTNRPGEGITVHGHWIIDLKDKDGTILEHRDFYNSLSPAGGSRNLSQLLTGTAIPSNLAIHAISSGFNAPFGGGKIASATYALFPTGVPAAATVCNALISSLGNQNSVYCVPGLTSTPAYDAGGIGSIQLSGMFTARPYTLNTNGSTNTVIDTVQTVLYSCTNSGTTTTTAACQAATTSSVSGLTFTETQIPTPISVSAGQTLLITVTLSFS